MAFEKSIETVLAADLLRKLAVGETCPYENLTQAMGKHAQRDGRSYVMAARKIAERENDCVFAAVDNVGILRLDPHGVVNLGGQYIEHGRRHFRRGMRHLTTLVPVEKQEALTPGERQVFLERLSHLGILTHMLKASSVKRLSEAVQKQPQPRLLPTGEILELFRNGKRSQGKASESQQPTLDLESVTEVPGAGINDPTPTP